jgi:hypothetical protein
MLVAASIFVHSPLTSEIRHATNSGEIRHFTTPFKFRRSGDAAFWHPGCSGKEHGRSLIRGEQFIESASGEVKGVAGEGDCVFDHQEAKKQNGLRDYLHKRRTSCKHLATTT